MTDSGPVATLARRWAFALTDPVAAAGFALGAAWVERHRGGGAVAVLPRCAHDHPEARAAAALARRLDLGAWDLVEAAPPDFTAVPEGRQAWVPVHLPSLGRDRIPRWQSAALDGILTELAAAEGPRLLVAAADAWPPGLAALYALAWIAGQGWRVVWRLPPAAIAPSWAAALALIGAWQLPLKVLLDPGDLDRVLALPELAGWWLVTPPAAEAAGALAWALAGEEPVLALLPAACGGREAWLPGRLRRVAEGRGGTWISAGEPRRAPPLGWGLAVVGSLWPLPVADLLALPPPLAADEPLAAVLRRHGVPCPMASAP